MKKSATPLIFGAPSISDGPLLGCQGVQTAAGPAAPAPAPARLAAVLWALMAGAESGPALASSCWAGARSLERAPASLSLTRSLPLQAEQPLACWHDNHGHSMLSIKRYARLLAHLKYMNANPFGIPASLQCQHWLLYGRAE